MASSGAGRERLRDLGWALAAASLGILVFLGSLRGGFVYDDHRQILQNGLIQVPGNLPRALVSDVWAFKGERQEAWSSYWRPGFVLWLAANWRLFGDDPRGWHASALLLHAVAVGLGFSLLRSLGAPRAVAGAAALVFAAHPAHVETVAWISGATDTLLAVFTLATLLLVLAASRGRRALYPLALVTGALALLAKEAAVALPILVFAAVWADPTRAAETTPRWRTALRAALPFLALTAVYLLLRWRILGRFQAPVPWSLSPLEILLTAPSLLAFYLRQALFPWALGPSYPLRAVALDRLGAANFLLPVLVLALAALAAWLDARRRPLACFGWALFLAPLLPAFNVNAYLPEHLVHDRYLYLPLLGIWLVLASWAQRALARGRDPAAAGRLLVAGAALLCLPLALKTHRYVQAWTSDVALWRAAVASDPGSGFNWAQLGDSLLAAGQPEAARRAADRALAIAPVTTALFTRASLARLQGRPQDARQDLERILAAQPDNVLAYEQLSRLFGEAGQLEQAAAVLSAGRLRAPYHRCAFASNLAVLRYRQGRKAEALAELEAVRPLAGREANAACTLGLFHLGALYGELGRDAEARQAYVQFLEVAESQGRGVPDAFRQAARRALGTAP